MYGELSQARSPSVFELRSSFNVPIERLALLETTLSIDGFGGVIRGRGGDSAINSSSVAMQLKEELANARSSPFFELYGSFKFRLARLTVPDFSLPIAWPDLLSFDETDS